MIQDYCNALNNQNEDKDRFEKLDSILEIYSQYIRWDRELKRRLHQRISTDFSEQNIRRVIYRPFIKQYLYADYLFSQAPGQTRETFPTHTSNNRAICVPGIGSTKPFSALIVDCMPDIQLMFNGQCFSRHRFIHREARSLLNDPPSLERVDNIPDTTLVAFRSHYQDPGITKERHL